MSHRLLVFCLLILGSLPHSSLSARPICNTFKYQKQTVTSCRGQGLFKFIRIPDNLGTATEHLLFDNNRIRVLKNASFVRYPKLSFISLRTNRLESIDLFAFSKLAKLRKLDFRENDLRLPSSWSSLALPATLETLDLSENPLGQLPDNHFAHLTRLKTFRAAEANLEVLHPDALAGLTSLRVLDLVNNRLMTLPEANTRRHLDAMPSLSGLRLGGANPWHCDCRLAWLKRWLQTHPFVSTLAVVRAPNEILELSPVCAAPRRLEGRELFSQRLPNTALRCRTPTSRSWVLDVFNSPDVPMYAAIAGGWLLALLAVCTAVTVCILPEEKFATPEAPAPSKAAVLKVPKPKMGTQSLSGAPLAKEPQIQLNHLPRATPNSPTQSREQRTPQYQLLSAQSPKIRQNVQPTGNQVSEPCNEDKSELRFRKYLLNSIKGIHYIDTTVSIVY